MAGRRMHGSFAPCSRFSPGCCCIVERRTPARRWLGSSGVNRTRHARAAASVRRCGACDRCSNPRVSSAGPTSSAQPDVVGFNCASDYWLDVAAFRGGCRTPLFPSAQGDHALDWSRAEDAVACYTGDLLEGFYDDWALRERERLRLLYLDCLGTLLRRHSETGALEAALRCGRQILALDPLREDIHREVIRLYVRNGHRALALKQYESCRAALEEELGVEPMEETRALCAELLSAATKSPRLGAPGGTTRETRTPAAGAKARIVPTLRNAAAKLDEARHELAEALRMAEADPNVTGENNFRR